ncbi:TPA: efflux transporter periplasmic adaptor subunit, partial [Klebsiella aerogenes]|nr:efflux transporter periplasmic adaptor subunit [Klebsiella aerogenes]
MSLQKTWGKRHLTAVGMVLLSALLAGCDEGVAQNAAPQAPAVSAAEVVVKS